MKFKVPRVFYIKGKKWTMRFADLSGVTKENSEHTGLYGETNFDKREVLIEKTLNTKDHPRLLEEVVMHELTHCMLFELHFSQVENFTPDIEEILCDGFADLVQSTLRKYFYR